MLQQKASAKRLHHRVVGEITADFDVFDIVAAPGLMLYTYSAEPGSVSEDRLQLLTDWATTNCELLVLP